MYISWLPYGHKGLLMLRFTHRFCIMYLVLHLHVTKRCHLKPTQMSVNMVRKTVMTELGLP